MNRSAPAQPRRWAAAVVSGLLLTAALGSVASAAPSGTRTVTGPTGQTLSVTPVDGLDPTGATIEVTGTGYDPSIGVYVAFCVDNGPATAPSPCIGGAGPSGDSTASAWISDNPPPYATELTEPYGPGGSFSVQLTITAQDGNVDCLDPATPCKVVTRADHLSSANRSADVKVPVSFATTSGPTSSTTTTSVSTTTPPTTAPPVTGPDGERTATGSNGQRVTVAPADDLDPAGAKVRVTGTGFDPAVGIYVAFCVDQGPSAAPTPCFGGADQSGASGTSRWISSNPPSYGAGVSTPFGPGGSFDVELNVQARDGSVDCLDGATRCVIATRADHTSAVNRTADVKVPVYFVGQNPATAAVLPVSVGPLPLTTTATATPRFTG
jgi:hypothetical protein